ncbi:MAG: GT4 family glycosyltransferase PelF [Lachnospiraceae bacterium]|nr:GT4 family glycosyltransferase PelF [Lachnospiraceae bacterium]
MKICMVAEGCYPYVVGGVSSWIHSMIQSFPEYEFIILAIVADRSTRGKFKYELPENVSAVYEVYLNDEDWGESKGASFHLKDKDLQAMESLLLNENIQWEQIFTLMENPKLSLDDLLMGYDYMQAVKECYRRYYSDVSFSDFLWTMRSIYLPMLHILQFQVPKADLYHCVATGYAGLLGAMAKHKYGCGLLVSEHGIYTREREEEIIRAEWVQGIYKNIWIDQFRKMSLVAYQRADLVTSLYEHARELQIELGCPPQKTMVTPNGINAKRFSEAPGKLPEDEGFVNIGAVARVTPIKDIKTMIRAFGYAKEKVPNLKLWIMGPTDEEETYAKECFDLVNTMHIPDVIFTGRVNTVEYIGRMDFTILTSISEGQPLTILEGYAAGKPAIATDVGNCRGLIYGEKDGLGEAGILTHIMNVEEITIAMVNLGSSPRLVEKMGEVGKQRVMEKYTIEHMKETYRKIYQDFEQSKET